MIWSICSVCCFLSEANASIDFNTSRLLIVQNKTSKLKKIERAQWAKFLHKHRWWTLGPTSSEGESSLCNTFSPTERQEFFCVEFGHPTSSIMSDTNSSKKVGDSLSWQSEWKWGCYGNFLWAKGYVAPIIGPSDFEKRHKCVRILYYATLQIKTPCNQSHHQQQPTVE